MFNKKEAKKEKKKIEKLVPRNQGDEVAKINEIIDYLNE